MDKQQIIILLLGSAAIAALVTSIVAALSQWRERIARHKELIISKSVELAVKHTEARIKAGELSKTAFRLYPEIVVTRYYHRNLELLFRTGKLDDAMEQRYKELINADFEISTLPIGAFNTKSSSQ